MSKTQIKELEKRYQTTALSASIEERFAMHEEYRRYLENQLQEDPKNIHTLLHLGILSWEPFHEDEKAIELLEKVIQYDPKNVEARFWLATCYYHDLCDYETAKKNLLEALHIDPYRPDCLHLLAILIRNTTQDWKQAALHLEQAVQHAPDWPMLRASLAEVYLEIPNCEKAEFHIQQAFLNHKPLSTKPKNFIEEYYEKIVTGRSWNLKEEFKDLVQKIQQAKIHAHNNKKNT